MGSHFQAVRSMRTITCLALLVVVVGCVQGHHVKCSDRLLPYCVCPDGTIRRDLDTVFNACGRGIKPDSCTCNDGAVINPNCVDGTYYCVDGSTCKKNLCCDNSHHNVLYIECPDGSTFPPVEVAAGGK